MDFKIALDKLNDNKRKILVVVLIFILYIVLVTFVKNAVENYNDKKGLEKTMVALGERVYIDAYYNNLKKSPQEYENTGIKITLDDIFEMINLESKDYFYNRNTKESCDSKSSYVIIYPIAPYGKNDYKLEFVLTCGY